MIDLSELLTDPDFSEPISIARTNVSWLLSGEKPTTSITIPAIAIVTPTSAEDVQQLPEGDRVSGAMTFRSTTVLQMAYENGATGSTEADIVTWRGQPWKIVYVWPWNSFGVPKAVGVLVSGQQA